MSSKREDVYSFIKRRAMEAIALASVDEADRAKADTIRCSRTWLAQCVADRIVEEYHFLELADIMEWKRQKVRR